MNEEFDENQLKGAREKARKYMRKSAFAFKRLRSYSDEDWESMGEFELEKNKTLLQDFERTANEWRLGAYGFVWDGGKLRRKPTLKELTENKQRLYMLKAQPKQ